MSRVVISSSLRSLTTGDPPDSHPRSSPEKSLFLLRGDGLVIKYSTLGFGNDGGSDIKIGVINSISGLLRNIYL